MLEGTDRSGAPSNDLGDVVNREVGYDPEEHNLGLRRGEGGDARECRCGADRLHHLALSVTGGDMVADRLCGARIRAAPGGSAPQVGQAPIGDGEHPRPEVRLGAVKAAETLGDVDEHVSRQVLRVLRSTLAEEREDARVQGADRASTAQGAPAWAARST